MPNRANVLVVDDETSVSDALTLILGERGHKVTEAQTGAQAVELLGVRPFQLVFTDLRLPDLSGLELLSRIKRDSPDTEVVLMTAHGSLDITIEAIKKGAYYYLEKPFTPDQVSLLAERALQFAAIRRENRALKRKLSDQEADFDMIGRSPQMRQIFETVRATALSDASVLIEGESGTGTELIATAFHRRRDRKSVV